MKLGSPVVVGIAGSIISITYYADNETISASIDISTFGVSSV